MLSVNKVTLIFIGLLFFTACGVQATTAPEPLIQQPIIESQTSNEVESAAVVEAAPVIIEQEANSTTTESTASDSTSPSTTPYSDDGCPDEHFLTVQANPNNSAYEAPSLTVTCSGTEVIIQTNNVPTFEFVSTTPNGLVAQDFTYTIPQTPVQADTVSDLPLLGATAVTVSGVAIYGPNEGGNLDFGDPYLDELLDYCNGHTGPAGEYHFHASPKCLFAEYEGQVGLVVGYALDGYPILAPYLCEDASCSTKTEVESSWQETNRDVTAAWDRHSYVEGLTELDQCNGMEFSDGSYVYFATDNFPYFMGCYRSEVSNANGGQNANNGGNQQDGDQQGGNNQQGPDLAAAAATLGVSEEALRDALGAPPPDLAAAAATLGGVSEEALRNALGDPQAP